MEKKELVVQEKEQQGQMGQTPEWATAPWNTILAEEAQGVGGEQLTQAVTVHCKEGGLHPR